MGFNSGFKGLNQKHTSTWDSRIILRNEIENRTVILSQVHEEPTMYERHVRIINTRNKNGLLC